MQACQEEKVRLCSVWLPAARDKGPICRPDQPSRDACCLGGARIQDVVQRLPKPVQPSDFYALLLFHLRTKDTARGNQYVPGAIELESSFAENGLGILVDIMNQQCAHAAKKVNGVFGYIRQSIASRSREVVIYSVLLRPPQEWPLNIRDTWYTEEAQWKARRIIKGL